MSSRIPIRICDCYRNFVTRNFVTNIVTLTRNYAILNSGFRIVSHIYENLYTNTVLGVSLRALFLLAHFFIYFPLAETPPKAALPEGEGNAAEGGCFTSN